MEVRHCDVCGVKLPELDMPGLADVARCEKCAASRGLASTTPPPLTPDGTARKTPIGGSSTAFAVPAKTPEPMPALQEGGAPTGTMGFYFCEKCGKRVTAADLARGHGRDKQLKGVHCAACSDGTMTVAFDAISQAEVWKEEQARRQGLHRSTSTRLPAAKEPRPPHRRSDAPRSAARIVAVVVVVALFSALLGFFFIGRSDPKPSHPSTSTSTASASTAGPASSSSHQATTKTEPNSGDRPAARQLAEIRTMITADLRDYTKVRQMLDRFSTSFAGTPEARDAQTLRSEIEEHYTKLAEDAFTDAVTAAKAGAASGAFHEAESQFRLIEARFGDGTWFESKGKAAVAEALSELAKQRLEWEQKNVAGTLDKAREELAAGRLEEAGKLVANRAKWPVEFHAQANELAAAIERKRDEAAAAKQRAAEGEALLAEFDRLMVAGQYVEARDYAKSKDVAGAGYGEMLRSGERLAGKMAGEFAAVLKGARTQLGKNVALKLASGPQQGILKAVTDAGMTVATTYRINDQEHERNCDLEWKALHVTQRQTFARLGGLEIEPSEEAILSVYAALGSGDMTAAHKALGAAGGHPLGVHLGKVVSAYENQLGYASAMALATKWVGEKDWQAAVSECQKALKAKPGDPEAVALLEKVRSLAAWTPAEIKTVAWYDAADPSTITHSDGAVSQWDDKSGNGYHATQGTDTARPKTGTRSLNGLNVLDFDGGDKLVSTFTHSGDRSAYVVFCYDTTGSIFVMDNRASFSATTFYALSSVYKNYNGGTAAKEVGVILMDTNPHFRDFIISGASGTNYHDGALDAAGTVGTNSMNGLSIGARYASGTLLNGYIAEIVLCAGAHDAGTRQKLEGYLAHKWGLQANLPADHPHKNAAPTQ